MDDSSLFPNKSLYFSPNQSVTHIFTIILLQLAFFAPLPKNKIYTPSPDKVVKNIIPFPQTLLSLHSTVNLALFSDLEGMYGQNLRT